MGSAPTEEMLTLSTATWLVFGSLVEVPVWSWDIHSENDVDSERYKEIRPTTANRHSTSHHEELSRRKEAVFSKDEVLDELG